VLLNTAKGKRMVGEFEWEAHFTLGTSPVVQQASKQAWKCAGALCRPDWRLGLHLSCELG
jgi:hypothetical protein